MTLKDLELAITSYCETVIAPQLASPMDRWIMFFGLGVAGAKLEAAIQAIAPLAATAGLIDESGNINVDLLEKAGYAAFEKQPQITIWKLTFRREDFSDFMRHLHG